jgi:hypothetical protein
MNALAQNDANKRKMIKCDLLSIYMDVARDKKHLSIEARANALTGIWLMTFVKEGVQACKQIDGGIKCAFQTFIHPSFLRMLFLVLQKMSQKSSKTKKHDEFYARMVKASAGALWNIEGPPRPATAAAKKSNDSDLLGEFGGPVATAPLGPSPPSDLANVTSASSKQHIMISYDWDHKEPVRKMNTALQALGYRTWLDVEQMSASKVFLKKCLMLYRRFNTGCYGERSRKCSRRCDVLFRTI